MRKNICLLIFISKLIFSSAQAAQITETGKKLTTVDNCSMLVEGVINEGDAKKIEGIILSSIFSIGSFELHNKSKKYDKDLQYVACLSGPGGNYLEGIEIAKLFAKHHITTVVPDHASCLSACAIAFLGGHGFDPQEKRHIPTRYVFPSSKLGFHAPLFSVPDQVYTEATVTAAYSAALQAIYELRKNAEALSIPERLLFNIIDHRDEDYFRIRTLNDAELSDIRLTGYRERKIQRDTFIAACWNSFKWYLFGHVLDDQNSYGPDTDSDWKRIFSAPEDIGNRFLEGGAIYEFGPWDGEVDCAIRPIQNKNGNNLFELALSDNGHPFLGNDPRIRGIYRSTILMRGSRTLESTR